MSLRRRAKRISTSILVLYRQRGDETWFETRALNLSESGILFGPAELHSGRQVEVLLSPPARIGKVTTGPQIYAGEVVRTTVGGEVAVRFVESWFFLES